MPRFAGVGILLIRGDDRAGGINRHDAFAGRQIRHVKKLKADLAIQCILLGIEETAAAGNNLVVAAEVGNHPIAFGSHDLSATIIGWTSHRPAALDCFGDGLRLHTVAGNAPRSGARHRDDCPFVVPCHAWRGTHHKWAKKKKDALD